MSVTVSVDSGRLSDNAAKGLSLRERRHVSIYDDELFKLRHSQSDPAPPSPLS